ncbi:MAG: type II toxin-antitoxin system VapC family toxin [Gemmataceae bacterium]
MLDTNHLSRAIRVVSPLRDRLRQTHRQGFRLVTCWPVLCELEEGTVFTANPAQYRRALTAMMTHIRVWPKDWRLVEQYGVIAKLAEERGRVLSRTDMILAAFARRENIALLSADRDFEAFPEINTENWTADM